MAGHRICRFLAYFLICLTSFSPWFVLFCILFVARRREKLNYVWRLLLLYFILFFFISFSFLFFFAILRPRSQRTRSPFATTIITVERGFSHSLSRVFSWESLATLLARGLLPSRRGGVAAESQREILRESETPRERDAKGCFGNARLHFVQLSTESGWSFEAGLPASSMQLSHEWRDLKLSLLVRPKQDCRIWLWS